MAAGGDDQGMREATLDDMPRLIAMGRLFHAGSGMPFGYNEEALSHVLAGLIASPTGAVIISDHGVIGGTLAPAYCDPEWQMAVELFWWAERDGMPLLRAFEQWAADMGANEVRMTSLASLPRADALLRRKGYAPSEISYSKVI
jgi:GNAT superfamily N-acetyltransferase